MNSSALVAVISDGSHYWTEVFQGDSPSGTLERHVADERWGTEQEARAASPWWPEDDPGRPSTDSEQRMHRALCSWSGCRHRIVAVAQLVADPEPAGAF